MKKVKIFLALGEGLDNESLELSDLVEHLNLILEPQNIHIYLIKSDYLTGSLNTGSGDIYTTTLDECEICMVIFGKDFGSYTEKELRCAYERVCKEGVNPSKLYVYFKNIEDLAEDLKRFHDSFPEAYGHFTGKFSDVNTLKNDFLLQFQLFQSQNLQNSCPVEVKNSKVTVFGKDLFIDLMKIPFLGNNETYTDLLKNIKKTKKFLSKSVPEDEDYAEMAEELHELEEKKEKIEQSIWNTALEIARLSNQKCSERLKKAIELFNEGDNKGASAILDTEDILKDAEHNLQMKRLHEEGLKTNIEELKLKIKTLENEMSEGWGEEVLKLHEKIMEYTKQVYGDKSEEYWMSLITAANAYEVLGKYETSKVLFKSALSIIELYSNNESKALARTYNDMSVLYSSTHDLESALDFGLKSLQIYKKDVHEKTADIATASENVGIVYFQMEEYDKALEYVEAAKEIRESLYGEEDLETVLSYDNIGNILREQGDLEKALLYGSKALNLYLKKNGELHSDTACAYNNISLTYSRKGDIKMAMELQQKAISIYEKIYGANHPFTAQGYSNLSMLYGDVENHSEALVFQTKAYEIRKSVFGENNEFTLLSKDALGEIYEYLGEFRQAIKFKEDRLKYNLKQVNRNDDLKVSIILDYNNIGTLYRKVGELEKSIEYKKNAITLLKDLYGKEHKDLIPMYSGIGLCFIELKDYDQALYNFNKSLEIAESLSLTKEMGIRMNRLARVYALKGDYNMAKEKFEEAISLLPKDHPEAIDSRKRLNSLYKL